ncbi:NusG domain II-containing protein [Clostridium lacusfryxellense]|uniref:NusG domain II-containing protein n=1 Tax=Clostridium lacusfryxellense TaxID=205328 RepID=UPI001C0C80B8|nr:NusG domain II-containing protein [Clostridium lacusfryxellense]MBU3111894.1 NusG domain II-containing protein [Clostridium lacusfryxellense]
MKKGDKIVGIVLLILVLLTLSATLVYKKINKGTEHIAVIKSDGKVIKTIDLNKVVGQQKFTVKTASGHFNTIIATKDSIKVKDADCLHKECVKSGSIEEPGGIIVCLPNKLMISIDGEKISTKEEENKVIDGGTF